MHTEPRSRFAVIGGGIRGSMFGTAIQQHPNAELVGMCDVSESVRSSLGRDLKVPVYSRADELLAVHPELTAAVIATPDFAHRDVAVACLDAGLDVLLEKPLATSLEDAEAIRSAAERSGGRVAVGFENRWNPRFMTVHDRLQADQSPVVNQVVNLNDTLFVPTEMISWAAQSSPAWFLMPHSLDMAMWLSGAEPTEVFARGRRRQLRDLGVDTWDAITASFAMSDGSLLTLNSQWVLPTSAPAVFDFRYEIHTAQRSFRLDISNGGITEYGPDGVRWPQYGVHEHAGVLRGGPVDMMHDFIDFTNGLDRDLPGVDQGVLVTAAIEAVHHSLDSGRPVTLSGIRS